MSPIYAIVYTEGEMTLPQLRQECTKKKWLPVMVTRPKGQKDAPPTIVAFKSPQVADRFVKRNLPQDQRCGWVCLGWDVIPHIQSQGWNIHVYDYPHKLHHPAIDVGLEIVYFPSLNFLPANCRI